VASVHTMYREDAPRDCTEKAARHNLSAHELGTCHCRECVPRTGAERQANEGKSIAEFEESKAGCDGVGIEGAKPLTSPVLL